MSGHGRRARAGDHSGVRLGSQQNCRRRGLQRRSGPAAGIDLREGRAVGVESAVEQDGMMRAARVERGFCVQPGDGRPLPAAGGKLLVGGAETAGGFSVVHSRAPAGDQVPLHVHHQIDECFYVLAGQYSVTCGAETFDAGLGALVYLPRGVPHAYQLGDEPGCKLIIGVPAGLEEFFHAMDRADVDLDELQHRHGVTFL